MYKNEKGRGVEAGKKNEIEKERKGEKVREWERESDVGICGFEKKRLIDWLI